MALDLDTILNEAVSAGASDVHLKAPTEPRIRVAGELLPMESHPPIEIGDAEQLKDRILRSELKKQLYETRGSADLSYHTEAGRFRVAVISHRGTPGFIFRVIPEAPEATGALFVRRGISTANKELPTADLRFRRNEQIRVEIPIASSDPLTARLLDRTGKPLAVPVTAAVRDDADGSRWATAQLALAPLAPADYAIEISSGDRRMISAFRVVP